MINKHEFYFDSWSEKYRKPFGAVTKGTSVSFFVRTSNVKEVYLKIHKDYGETFKYAMQKVEDGFSTTFVVEEVSLYFYHFEMVNEDGTIVYYGNTSNYHGGSGELYSNRDYQITVYDVEDHAPLWYQEGRAYHVFLDRFARSSKSFKHLKENSFIYSNTNDLPMYIKDSNGDIVRWDFYGGDLWGLIDQLNYLKEMGITILYLSPIFTARSNHRYDTQNYLEIDPMLGGEQAFKKLLKETKKLEMKIILDGVFNHCGADSIYFDLYNKYGNGAYHNVDSPYRSWFNIRGENDYEAWWGILDLPRFKESNLAFRTFILEVITKWSKLEIGGWRLDVADELEDDFILQIRSCLNEDQVLLGEVWEDPTNKISYNQRRRYVFGKTMHGVMNYPFREAIIQYLNKEISAIEFKEIMYGYLENYPTYLLLNNLNNIGSHDTKRIKTELKEDETLVKLAFVMMFVLPGVPCIYYGDEIGLQGEKDPDNRRFFKWDNVGNELQQFIQEQLLFRKNHPVLWDGELKITVEEDCVLIHRKNNETSVTFVINPNKKEYSIEK